MARLAAPPSPVVYRTSLQIPAPSQPISIQSVLSTSDPVAKRSKLPRPVLHQAVPKSQIASKATGHSTRVIIPSSRADYDDAAGTFAASQIPRPITAALKAVSFRRCSQILQRLPSVIIRPARAVVQPPSPVLESTAVSSAPQYLEPEDDDNTGADESSVFCEEGDTFDNSEFLLEDRSFGETVGNEQQVNYPAFLARTVVFDRRLGSDGRGCAMGPSYAGDTIVLGRKRKLPVSRVLFVKQQHASYTPATAPRKSRLPFLVWPLTKPVNATRSAVAAPAKPAGASFLQRGSRSVKTTLAKVAGKITRKVAVAPAPVKPVAPGFLRKGRVMRKLRSSPAKVAREEVVAPVKPATTPFLRRATVMRKLRVSPVKTAPQVVAAPEVPATPSFLQRRITRRKLRTSPVKAVQHVDVAPVSAGLALKSAFRNGNFKRRLQPVHFADSPVKTTFFSVDDPVEQISAVSASPDETPEWSPFVIQRQFKYPVSKAGNGTGKMFEHTDNGPMTLTREFLNRFASVQRAEALRLRHQAMAAAGERQELGQLEYGNTDTKVALDAKGSITHGDIGIAMNCSDLSPCASPAMGRVLVFGRFPGAVQDAPIPMKAAVPYRKEIPIPKGMKWKGARQWIKTNMRSLQPADLER